MCALLNRFFLFEHHVETKQMANLGTGCFSWVILLFKFTVNIRVPGDEPAFFRVQGQVILRNNSRKITKSLRDKISLYILFKACWTRAMGISCD